MTKPVPVAQASNNFEPTMIIENDFVALKIGFWNRLFYIYSFQINGDKFEQKWNAFLLLSLCEFCKSKGMRLDVNQRDLTLVTPLEFVNTLFKGLPGV